MEESRETKLLYDFMRLSVFILLALEFFIYAYTEDFLFEEHPIAGFLHRTLSNLTIYKTGHLLACKGLTVMITFIACLGTRARKSLEFDARRMVLMPAIIGGILLTVSYLSYEQPEVTVSLLPEGRMALYMLTALTGTMCVMTAGDNISRYIKEGLGKDRFNFENESFQQTEQLTETKYSVNIPMRYYFKGKFRKGWINIVNPFRGTWVVGTPGSGKTFSVIEPFIRQHSAKGFAMVVYDYKFPTLATKLYYHYRVNKEKGLTPPRCSFNIINFVDVEYSKRVNPIQQKYIPNLAAAQETAETLIDSLHKGKDMGGGGSDQFFKTSAVNLMAACIYFFVNYKKLPFDEEGNELYPQYTTPTEENPTPRLTGRCFRDKEMTLPAEPAYWRGKYSDMPHVLAFLNHEYNEIFEVLRTDPEVYPLMAPFMTAYENDAMEQLEGMIGTLRVQTSRLATKEAFWIFHKDGDDFDLKVSDPKNPCYLLIANDPEMESIIGALNALILNRLVTRVNSGQGKNVPVSIIVDELPTLFFYKIDRLIGTARSNKVAVTLGFQELPQLEADYGKVGMQKIITTVGNVISGSARAKETLEWLSNDIFGKVVQLKKGFTINESSTSVNLNENMDNLVPASKISDMPTGWIAGQVARDFVNTKTGVGGRMNIQKSEEFQTSKFYCKTNFDMAELKKEERSYKKYPLPKFYNFPSQDTKERILYQNMEQVKEDVENLILEVTMQFKKEN